MWTDEETVAAGHSIEPARWRDAFEGLLGRIAGRFARVEPRRRAARLVLGLLADLPRKNCWTIAEWAGETTPDGMQHLLGKAKWNADQVRDDVCGYVVEHLHDDRAVLVVDETGDVKKGTGTVGVQRQYTGTAGPTPGAKVGAAPYGHRPRCMPWTRARRAGRTATTDRRSTLLRPQLGKLRASGACPGADLRRSGVEGNSVEVLLSRYAKCLDGRQEVASRRIEDLLREYE